MKLAGDAKALQIPGMTVRDLLYLYAWALHTPRRGVAVEIGSYLGSSAACIAAAIRHRKGHLFCVDTWKNDAMNEGPRDTFSEFLRNTAPWRTHITPLRGLSAEVAGSFDRVVDFLFVDGDHSYGGCCQDVGSWLPKLRSGGSLVLHDYPRAAGVARVVKEILNSGRVTHVQTRSFLCHCRKI
jgi:predicted O-methyltransferase YrrM